MRVNTRSINSTRGASSELSKVFLVYKYCTNCNRGKSIEARNYSFLPASIACLVCCQELRLTHFLPCLFIQVYFPQSPSKIQWCASWTVNQTLVLIRRHLFCSCMKFVVERVLIKSCHLTVCNLLSIEDEIIYISTTAAFLCHVCLCACRGV